MRHDPWMERDERSEQQKAIDHARYTAALKQHANLSTLKNEERRLMSELERVQAEIAKLPAIPRREQR